MMALAWYDLNVILLRMLLILVILDRRGEVEMMGEIPLESSAAMVVLGRRDPPRATSKTNSAMVRIKRSFRMASKQMRSVE